jgi:DNA-binding GntR family transcriptional regulator
MSASTMQRVETRQGRGNTVEYVVSQLRDGILRNRYAPGYRLVEADLTHELGVSRGPVREGLRRLSAEGFIDMVPNRGAVVRRLTMREAIELYQLRTALEALAAKLAAENARDPRRRAQFKAATAAIWNDDPRLDPSAYIRENSAFHEAVLELAGNEQLAKVSRQMKLPLILLQTFQATGVLEKEHYLRSIRDHRRMAKLILAGKADQAETAMRAHLEGATERLKLVPESFFRAPRP